jgi:hypothetical protein
MDLGQGRLEAVCAGTGRKGERVVKNKHIGSTFSSFLDEEGIREEVELRAKKKILADQS